ncbi:MAG: 50S ribosomal protein L35 [Bifidobacteriaceae bacterium]|jgi:large subunit ribosomal protein L35|nr:50S ribosomal protein L35 [Bifidobacteriaceae bacterium]
MPKMKTHSGSKKRFRVTGTGKIMHEQPGMRHNFESKPSRRTRRLSQDQVLAKPEQRRARKLLGI